MEGGRALLHLPVDVVTGRSCTRLYVGGAATVRDDAFRSACSCQFRDRHNDWQNYKEAKKLTQTEGWKWKLKWIKKPNRYEIEPERNKESNSFVLSQFVLKFKIVKFVLNIENFLT